MLPVDTARERVVEYDFAVETEATESAFRVLLNVVRPGGIVVLKSRPANLVPFDVATAVRKNLSLHAVCYGSFVDAVELLVQNAVQVDDLLGPMFHLEQFNKALIESDGSGAAKIFCDLTAP